MALPTALLERMKKLREDSNPKTTSDSTDSQQPTSLATYLCIYNKAGKECFLDYMAGAKALLKYLGPIVIPDIPEELLPSYMPGMFHAYEVTALSDVLYPSNQVGGDWLTAKELKEQGKLTSEVWIARSDYIQRVIVYLTCKEITDGKAQNT